MPKLKSNSSAKKRFSFTGTGKVRMNPANKRHGLVKRPKQMKRQTRGTDTLSESDAPIVKRYLLPYGDKFQK
jgi:large subunit ribosomal protein L35